ncbi:conserved hypothetical protein [Agrobacterium tumefaciens str. Kerr 14]|uniref:Uncharacterized protein n=1 Tax=Agrobacterium tumefaciens str. Kerr 14 TaxID=1183424 RepID=A0A1S7PDF3_AGRTU|nr:conserved hypothetical protein [Agrobacterium tumefaciens str. Kerr 14]
MLSSSDENLMQVRQFVKVLFKLGQMLVVMIALFDFGLGRIDTLLQRVGRHVIGRNRGFGKKRAAGRQNIGKTTENHVFMGLTGSELHRYQTRLDRGHRRRVIGQNGHFTQRSRDDDFRNRFGNEQTLRGNEIEFETVSHGYSLLFNYAGVTDLSFTT